MGCTKDPKTRFIITATKAGSKTITYSGTTNAKGGASVSGKGNFAGWKFSLKMLAK